MSPLSERDGGILLWIPGEIVLGGGIYQDLVNSVYEGLVHMVGSVSADY